MVIASFRGMVYLRGMGSDTVVYKIFQHNLLYRLFSFQPNKNGISPVQKLFNSQLRTNLHK